MTMKKITWKSVIFTCSNKSKSSSLPESDIIDKQVVKQLASFQRLSLSDLSNPSSRLSADDLSNSVIGSKLHVFTLAELRIVTANFSRSNMLGEGGFGPVYKGFVDDKMKPGLKAQPVAVKALDLDGLQGHKEWMDYTAKLSDFGLAKDGPEGEETHVITRVMGTQGYAAPEYVMTELLTGKRAMDNTRSGREQSLVEWARPLMKDPRKLERLIDPRLEGQFSATGAQKAVALAYKCLSHHPKPRPSMSEVVKALESLQDFQDSFVGPFVYVVPNENDSKENFAKGKEVTRVKEKDSSEENGQRNHVSWRHRVKLPMSMITYADSGLYKKFVHSLNSPNHHKEKGRDK
ncbi:hypothetical protein Patl1_13746 [Pistacia atlantica]|uniref:Uncharacterized protein n=1 Tax=Pistacia atlantica TaxID=434234 RepID=A0ACC1ATX4_9ROSI|nr:hypothetical protein Patl1_13746 [Pistacia atlantica]